MNPDITAYRVVVDLLRRALDSDAPPTDEEDREDSALAFGVPGVPPRAPEGVVGFTDEEGNRSPARALHPRVVEMVGLWSGPPARLESPCYVICQPAPPGGWRGIDVVHLTLTTGPAPIRIPFGTKPEPTIFSASPAVRVDRNAAPPLPRREEPFVAAWTVKADKLERAVTVERTGSPPWPLRPDQPIEEGAVLVINFYAVTPSAWKKVRR